ncbi:hypothetical protein [Burkholderia anthina]|uniref:hypothetical protein n=1 Tax=Burkholderia anthina TaxID=179879 RepID=UPI001AA03AC7|nr:hypothetical protein [Burkholderia anthina]QTD90809.1 hypothetical protein J4G50_05275 [Burkholderia anthina]
MGALSVSPLDRSHTRAIRIAALELLLVIEQTGVEAEPAFLETLHRLAEDPVRKQRPWRNRLRIDLRPLTEAAR